MLIYFFLFPMFIETGGVPFIPPCPQAIPTTCKLENVNRSFSICYCTNQTLCPCFLENIDFFRQHQLRFQNNSIDRFGTKNYSEKGSLPLHLIFSCMIIFILILIVFAGMICTCFCSKKSHCCLTRRCSLIANLDSQTSNSNSSYSTNYTENEPPPMYSQEMLKDSQKSEKLPDYKSLFAIEFQQQQQQRSDQF